MQQLDAIGTFEALREAFFRYYDSPFGLADERLQNERRDLFDRPGGIYRRPLIEVRPQYQIATSSLAESIATAGLPGECASFLTTGLIPPGRPLYTHQEQSLILGSTVGRNVVITAGTGSGKTESFLLPIIASLVDESRSWTGSGARGERRWWSMTGRSFEAQRSGETGRRAAVRAMILYPMNALVDDQLIRLRNALDSNEARLWLDEHRRGHRFYFGRYTGATPVTGARDQKPNLDNLAKYMRETAKLADQAAKSAEESHRYFVPRFGGAELPSRWDMEDYPPDILITNYSMLNVMLLRQRDAHFFRSTREWLFEKPENRFTLVVDELHSYRGTAGTEVALLIRNLKHRLGIAGKPEKLRVLAASASLDARRDRAYLEQFFGVDAASFEFLEGDLKNPSDPRQLDFESAPGVALENAFRFDANRQMQRTTEAKSEAELAAILSPHKVQAEGIADVHRLLARAASEDGDWPRMRSHLFFRNVPGVWACSDSRCDRIPSGSYEDRTVGKLFGEPRTRCECGARVLELLYCQNCGDVFLGGFTAEGVTQQKELRAQLLADIPDLSKLPDQVGQERTSSNYLIYWPRTKRPEVEDVGYTWTAQGGDVEFSFLPCRLNASTGELTAGPKKQTGWTFRISVKRHRSGPNAGDYKVDPSRLPGLPTKCPNCSDDREVKYSKRGAVELTDPIRLRSPIRTMRTGFEKINQVLITELAQQLPEPERRLIVFTDSRQDAAKLSSGIGLRHYQDLLRILLHESLGESTDRQILIDAARRRFVDGERSSETADAVRALREVDRDALDKLRDHWEDVETSTDEEVASLVRRFTGPARLSSLSLAVRDQLLIMGINPGGPKPSLAATEPPRTKTRIIAQKPTRWPALYDWRTAGPPRARAQLGSLEQSLLGDIDQSLREEVLDGLFSGAGRDFESLGLGWLAFEFDTLSDAVEPASGVALARSSLRVLGDMRRFFGLRNPAVNPPAKLKKFWEALGREHSLTFEEVQERVLRQWSNGVQEFLINDELAVLRAPSPAWWICEKCRRPHLHRGAGLCTRCARRLPVDSVPVQLADEYYGWKATNHIGRFRLSTAELTGQTDRLDAQSRQARFQGVFLDEGQHELADAVDLLSVTTTMEAGVDIGSLEAVVLGNMPPSRFNYQQRVGRAGRRDSPVAIALTVCRGRSHDEYYFDRPHRITNDATPAPYLTLGQESILQRVLNAESLRMAFAGLSDELASLDGYSGVGTNTHGQFGAAVEWPTVSALVQTWLSQHREALADVTRALAERSGLESKCDEFVDRSQNALVREIDEVVTKPGSEHLSQRLAEHGLLPMFGFPSKVRYLYLKRPTVAYPWPPRNIIDRDSAMAVSQFSPTSELVKDGSVHPVVGIAAFKPAGPRVAEDGDALGELRPLDVCRVCSFMADRPADRDAESGPCPRCGAEPGSFQTIPMYEPLGYRAGRKRDFDGNFAWSSRAAAARAMTDLDRLAREPIGDAVAYSGSGYRFVLNDRGGKLFEFRKDNGYWGGYVSVDAVRRGDISDSSLTGAPKLVALGSVQPTDFMFLGSVSPTNADTGVRLNLHGAARQPSGSPDLSEGRRAAWYSLAFLLRTVAAAYLDLQPAELTAGIYSGLENGEPSLFAFIADTLENGAGFSSHLGSSIELPKFLDKVEQYLEELGQAEHSSICNSSCYRCLRDYGNMAYHALLDWRLAADLFGCLRGRPLPDRLSEERAVLGVWAEGYGAEVVASFDVPVALAVLETNVYGREAVIVRHPLEAAEHGENALISPRMATAFAAAEELLGASCPIYAVDSFVLDRDPAAVRKLAEKADRS
nr:DEAD/DEAH box helicase [Antrihabitans stalactiti]